MTMYIPRYRADEADAEDWAIDESDAAEMFREELDGLYEPFRIGEVSYPASLVLEETDPVAFRVALSEYMSEEFVEWGEE